MKGIILCAGEGTRLRPLTHTQPKVLLPVANRPVLHWAMAALRDAGCDRLGVVSSPEWRPAVAAALAGTGWGAQVQVMEQTGPRGIAGAVLAARDFLGAREPFAVYLGDNLLEASLAPAAARFARGDGAALLLLKEVPNPSVFGVAILDGERVVQVVEKPRYPPGRLAICGVYFFTAAVWDALGGLRPSARGELEITDAIAALIAAGAPVLGFPLSGYWHDMGSFSGYLAANREVLDRLPAADQPPDDAVAGSRLEGRIHLAPGARVVRSVVRGPVVVGPGATVEDAYVGPYTSIGAGARVVGAGVEHSVILENAVVEHLPYRLCDCLLGRGVLVAAGPALPRAASLVVGDDSRLFLPPERGQP